MLSYFATQWPDLSHQIIDFLLIYLSRADLNFSIEPGELFLDEAAVLVVELSRRLQDRRRNVVRPNVLQMSMEVRFITNTAASNQPQTDKSSNC